MLEEISIKDLGVIQSARLPFTKGFTVITGETGAGKTMVLTALSLLLGKRSDSSLVRHGAELTSVEGCWNVTNLTILPAIEEVGAVLEDDNTLYMNRTVHKDGKSRAVVGGKSTPAATLATIGEGLVNIHGQSDQIRLKSATAQREALDSYAGEKLQQALQTYQNTYKQWKDLTALIKDIKTNMVSRQHEYEELTKNLEELEKISPVKGEDEALQAEAAMLANVETLQEGANEAQQYLSNDDYNTTDVITALNNVVRALSHISEYDPKIKELYELAESVKINTEELSSELATYLSNIDTDSLERLNEVQERRAQLNVLIRKYGITLDDVIEYWEKAFQRLEQLGPEGADLETLEKKLAETQAALSTEAQTLTQIRQTAKTELEEKVNAELAGLMMAGNKLQINLTTSTGYTSYGVDEISFMLKTPGAAEPRPINKAASGGELSRIMLALEVVLANPKITPTFIFDEVDSGVGGATAIEIGKRLAQLAKEAQVIVVTHLPQVAAFADNHLRVLKSASDNFVATDVKQLTKEEQVEELARMLSGLADSETGKSHALELLEKAKEFK